jgi:general secretion pathway protein G
MSNQKGFTLIELLVVLVILSVLATIIGPKLFGRTEEARRTSAKVQIRNIESALALYERDNGTFPTTEQGLKALVEKPENRSRTIGTRGATWKRGKSRSIPGITLMSISLPASTTRNTI